jgi:hypothetical protein
VFRKSSELTSFFEEAIDFFRCFDDDEAGAELKKVSKHIKTAENILQSAEAVFGDVIITFHDVRVAFRDASHKIRETLNKVNQKLMKVANVCVKILAVAKISSAVRRLVEIQKSRGGIRGHRIETASQFENLFIGLGWLVEGIPVLDIYSDFFKGFEGFFNNLRTKFEPHGFKRQGVR